MFAPVANVRRSLLEEKEESPILVKYQLSVVNKKTCQGALAGFLTPIAEEFEHLSEGIKIFLIASDKWSNAIVPSPNR